MVGERLAEIREQKALTLHDLEERSGVGADGISKIENGHRKPRPSTLRKLARALGVEVEDFFREPALPLDDAPREAGQWLLQQALLAALLDETKEQSAAARLFASEGVPQHVIYYEEDKFRAELISRGFPDEYFEDFIWPLVRMARQADLEESRARSLEQELAWLKATREQEPAEIEDMDEQADQMPTKPNNS